VREARRRDRLVVQPRMGFSEVTAMKSGLLATRGSDACAAGTITLDSFTRVGDHAGADSARRRGEILNGFPVVAHGAAVTDAMVADVCDADFPVQVRHGTPCPDDVMAVLVDTRIDATEGGPISYALPYGRTPLEVSIASWERCSRRLARQEGTEWHLETFGGCMLGQLCPPGLLVAISVLESIFFARNGITSVSLSYTQQTNPAQDLEALGALRSLASRHLVGVDWHVVLYSTMGLFPETAAGARRLLRESARLARQGQAERLVVKTRAEAHRIPTVAENIAALEEAARVSEDEPRGPGPGLPNPTLEEASRLVDCVLEESQDIGSALLGAFRQGRLDVPYCLHPDNANRARSFIDEHGWLRWSDRGAMPIDLDAPGGRRRGPSAEELLAMLTYNRRRFDRETTFPGPPTTPEETADNHAYLN
jgi:methylaspartate mutase epsilon subunit